MPSSPSLPSPQVLSVEQVGSLSRWGRVALVSRAAMRTVLWFKPGQMRTRSQALSDLLAIDICNTLGMLAAAGARQLSAPVAEAAANAALAALAAPGRVPLLATDHAAMLAGMTVEWAGASTPPDALDAGTVDNARAALGDLQTLLALGMQERGYEYPVPASFFSLPLWPAQTPDLRQELAQWEGVLAPFNLLEFSERFRNWAAGSGMDWVDAQRRAEAWVRMVVPVADAPASQPPASAPATPSGSLAPPPVYRSTHSSPHPSTPSFPAVPLSAPLPPLAPVGAPYRAETPPATPSHPEGSPVPLARRKTDRDATGSSKRGERSDPRTPEWKTPLPGTVRRVAPVPSTTPAPNRPTLRVPAPPRNATGFADLEPYANALASLIDSLDPTAPLTLAIQGPNGSGRSVIGGMLRRRLSGKPCSRGEEPHLTMWFDANVPRSSPTLTTSLMRALAVALDLERPALNRHLHRLSWGLQPVTNTWKYIVVIVAAVLSILAVAAAFGLMTPGIGPDLVAIRHDMVEILNQTTMGDGLPEVAALGGLLSLAALFELFGFLMPCGQALARYVHDRRGAHEADARSELAGLLKRAVPRGARMVVFVEDLETAGVARARDFLESLKTVLKFPELVFVLLTDAHTLRLQAADEPVEHEATGARSIDPDLLSGVVDLQVDLPARQIGRPGQDSSTSRSSGKRASVGYARGLAAFWGPWSRDWRGDRRVEEVLQRTMYVDPPYLAPLVMMFWVFYWLPVAAFVNVQDWVYPPRGVRIFSQARTTLWHVLLTLAVLGHGVLVFQTLDGLLTNLHYVILYPDTRPLSLWVFVPLELVTMGLILLFGAWIARANCQQEMSTIKQAREVLRARVKDLHAGVSSPLQAAASLKGLTKLRDGEDVLVRETVVNEYLVSEPDLLKRLHAMVELASGLKA